MNEATTTMLINLAAGLGLFLFGMSYMSQGMQKAAGVKLRGLLEAMTKNRVIAVLFGAAFTAIIQSSGATTVMVVSFVNAGLMSLEQSIGITFGANIGTTITAQLVSLKLTAFAPYILLVGAICMVFIKKPIVKLIGEVILGFGCLFMGISLMTEAMQYAREIPTVVNVFSSLKNPILAIILGFAITTILQSSSVTVSIMVLLAGEGLVALPICLFFILGCNIGSCAPAVIASFDGNKEAKRAAAIHVMFNVFGMIIIGIILAFFMDPVLHLLDSISGDSIKRAVANADTLFKVFQTIIFFPFADKFIKLTYLIIPGEDKEETEFHLQYIGIKNTIAPTTGVLDAVSEIKRMGDITKENLKRSWEAFETQDEEKLAKVYEQEKLIDYLSNEITHYLIGAIALDMPAAESARVGAMFHVVSDIERIGDHAENIADAAKQRYSENVEFSKKALKELEQMMEQVMLIFDHSLEMFTSNTPKYLEEVIHEEQLIDEMEREFQKTHVKRMSKGKCDPKAGIIFTDLVTGLERIGDHSTNIAYSILDSEPIDDVEEN